MFPSPLFKNVDAWALTVTIHVPAAEEVNGRVVRLKTFATGIVNSLGAGEYCSTVRAPNKE